MSLLWSGTCDTSVVVSFTEFSNCILMMPIFLWVKRLQNNWRNFNRTFFSPPSYTSRSSSSRKTTWCQRCVFVHGNFQNENCYRTSKNSEWQWEKDFSRNSNKKREKKQRFFINKLVWNVNGCQIDFMSLKWTNMWCVQQQQQQQLKCQLKRNK